MKIKVQWLWEIFNDIERFKCHEPCDGVYLFTKLGLFEIVTYRTNKTNKKKKKIRYEPEQYHYYKISDSIGIFIDPGTGFTQRHGTHHIRRMFL